MTTSTPATAVTASAPPESFPTSADRKITRPIALLVLILCIVGGFALRAGNLGAEGLSEDELNKWEAVADYRVRGMTASNGEHPMLMKALQTASVVACEHWNATTLARSNATLQISPEASLRLPSAIFGALTALLIFLVTSELFGAQVGLIAAVLWSFDPTAIGLNRMAKEDSFFAFFFLLANLFWVRSRRMAETGTRPYMTYIWVAAALFGPMLAAKYYPHMLAVSGSYYYIFQGIPATRWRMGKRRWLLFFAIMGVTFLLCNLTILLPGTWHEMRIFATERRVGHDAYEYMGTLYHNQLTYWLRGVPWTFYFVFTLIKIPLLTVSAFLCGVLILFRKRIGDGRYFILFWLVYFLPFSVLGGKFTRYYTIVLPAVHITAAIGALFISNAAADFFKRTSLSSAATPLRALLIGLLIAATAYASLLWGPHYRLYTNALGGGREQAGSVFPHDDFYDASVRDTARYIAAHATPGVRVASEVPRVFAHYTRLAGRDDIGFVSLTDHDAMRQLRVGDFVVVARGRRYFSNDHIVGRLNGEAQPAARFDLDGVPSVKLYVLDESSLAAIKASLE